MNELQLVDRSSMIDALNRELELRPSEVAIVTIDMHRGHLDPGVATMPTSAEEAARVIGNARASSLTMPARSGCRSSTSSW